MQACFRTGVLFLLSLTLNLWGNDAAPHQVARRVHAHLVIKDARSAYDEAKRGLLSYPGELSLHTGYIRSLASLGMEKEMLDGWHQLLTLFPDQKNNHELLEEMAWAILAKGNRSSSPLTRQIALLAAFFCQDAKGVALIIQGMHDQNYAIRTFSTRLAGHMHDAGLAVEVKRLFHQEKIRAVRLEAIKAAGNMKMVEMKEDLEKIILSKQFSQEEKALAVEGLVHLLEGIQDKELVHLAQSPHGELRLLACKAIAQFDLGQQLPLLLNLAKDQKPSVRAAAFQAFGLIRPQESDFLQIARQGANKGPYESALSAAWLLALYAPEEGGSLLEGYLFSSHPDVRMMAAAALKGLGPYGMSFCEKHFTSHFDPFVRVNLSLALIGQRLLLNEAAEVIKSALKEDKRNWCHKEYGQFEAVCLKKHNEKESDFPTEAQNQLTRLQMYNVLAQLKTPGIEEEIRLFLLEKTWGITGSAAALLLSEGGDAAIEVVRHLMHDPSPALALQAALIVSLWSREEAAIAVLEKGYAGANMDVKIKILEGLGRIGSHSSLPFLVTRLHEASQTLRLISAMSLIQCLNH
ncbi:MAG: HEAT repeat domain-containing protein [Parachlamydia sp.]|jgi:hypothetical protein|nr:HEAT repeat domain-containing protein [Parachlamydia sp.]